MPSKLDAFLNFQTQALNLRAQRQQVLAANIANADTPNYKARDIDFHSALDQAVHGRAIGGLKMATTAARHIAMPPVISSPLPMYRAQTQASADGNTVDMDVERAQFADNSIQYEASVSFISGQFRGLLDAMQPVR